MKQKIDIHKAMGILIKDRKLLVTRQKDKDFFIGPGGKLDGDETFEQALVRELKEEVCVEVFESDLSYFGTFVAEAAGKVGKIVEAKVYLVSKWSGEISINPNDKVEEFRWIDSKSAKEIKLGSIFGHEVIPRMVEMGLID